MKLNLEGVAKAVYVGFLLILWAVLIKLDIRDDTLIDVIKALIGVVVGWHGINEWGGYRRAAQPLVGVATLGGYQPVDGPLGDPPAPRATPDTLPPVRQAPPPMPAVVPAARADGAQQ
ncbi:hypothetical protein [Burkholderia sp. JKS000303]|uniref:hypothetical protein n=1 Tax=Burkholderia sp. JKS000303 TaxID=1938747 RepID=UPI000BF974BF|nr:hypothetical protein [Burkholderia sp. JKS000303]PFH13056.1 hypothetical protein BX604_7482 [Burkholderia sp. JKS000303]